MVSQEQWEDAYVIAEKMFNEGCPIKRTDMNILEQIICSRYSTIFNYDPYTDEYSFIRQQLKSKEPVNPHCRTIAESDLDNLKKNTMNVQLQSLTYMNITPIYVVAPSTMLVFNHDQKEDAGLKEALLKASTELTLTPTESEVTPGAEFVFRHKNGKCFRVVVISEVGEDKVAEGERRYEVAFLDYCQIAPVKLKTLFMPLQLTLENYPCALHCARPLGVVMFRPGFVDEYNTVIKNFYNDKKKRKDGVQALNYIADQESMKLVIDFPSINNMMLANSREVIKLHGHRVLAGNDPYPMTHEELTNMEILPLVYPPAKDENADNKGVQEVEVEKVSTEEDDEVDLDTSDSQSIEEAAKMKEIAGSDCPFGRNSIENFIQKKRESNANALPYKKTVEPSHEGLPRYTLPMKSIQEQQPLARNVIPFDTRSNDSMSSFRSAALNQINSSNPTPQPTFDDNSENEQATPTKTVLNADDCSSDGWDTPKKLPNPRSEVSRKLEAADEFAAQRPLKKVSTSIPIARRFEPPSLSPLQRPSSPIPQTVTESDMRQATLVPLMDIKTYPSCKKESSEKSSLNAIATGNNGEGQHPSSSVDTCKKIYVPSDSFGRPPVTVNDQNRTFPTSAFSEKKENKPKNNLFDSPIQKSDIIDNGSSINGSIVKSNKGFYLDNDVLESTNHEEGFQTTMIQAPEHVTVFQDANISKASTNQMMINTAQEKFQDTDDDDAWGMLVSDYQKVSLTTEERLDQNVQGAGSIDTSNAGDDENCVENKRNAPKLDVGDSSAFGTNVDEYAEVPDAFKQFATSYIDAVRNAALQNNRPVFMVELFTMEMSTEKMPGELIKRFWKTKLAEAKSFDKDFD